MVQHNALIKIQEITHGTIINPDVRIELLDEIPEERGDFIQEVSERKMQVKTFPVYYTPELYNTALVSLLPHEEINDDYLHLLGEGSYPMIVVKVLIALVWLYNVNYKLHYILYSVNMKFALLLN